MIILSQIISFVRHFLKKIKEDAVSAYSAQAAFFTILSSFPFLMLLLTLIQYLPLTESNLLTVMIEILPDAVSPYVVSIIHEIYTSSSITIISVTALTALWSASKAFLALIQGLNTVYDIKETRNYFHLRTLSSLYTLTFAVMLIITLLILVFGNSLVLWLTEQFPKLNELLLVIISIRATAFMCIMVLFFLALYKMVPNRKTHLLAELPGAILTAAGWMGFSYLYSFYIDHSSNLSNTYGSLTTIVFLMLWLYVCMYMLFIGAEFNVFLQDKNFHE